MANQDESKSQSWFRTIPGMLTGLAAVITAITGLVVGLNQIGLISLRDGNDRPPATTSSSSSEAASAESLRSERTTSRGGDALSGGRESAVPAEGMGTLRTSAGELVFDRITDMSMGNGALSVSQLGTRVDIPLEKIQRITFEEGNQIRIDYWDGRSETTEFHCYWNLPVTFHAGEKEIYYGDCNDFRVVEQIEFHRAG